MFGGKALGWMAGASIWMPGVPGKRTLLHPSTPCAASANNKKGPVSQCGETGGGRPPPPGPPFRRARTHTLGCPPAPLSRPQPSGRALLEGERGERRSSRAVVKRLQGMRQR